ncbi:hypothetical protein JAO76_00265 [Pontibacter sp. BT310]|uniref:TIGR02588 family protein n=1 Tax=Pontibacter populi TaxID=890055 RepID=A0ABS6X637_9BACT|nr:MULTISPECIES: hypothetical protein [Pontibacter]MBJ6116607.1 hypothetical protein [Pontibacter sp. BT310]MBR0569031.1 hypothetical protein [Microvirga sp. STS03]MBW3363460.1 hypothetical protein [Pontibacter populi]
MNNNRNRDKNKENKDDEKNWLEWLVFAVSLLLLLGIFGYLGYMVKTYDPTDPKVFAKASHDPSEEAPNRYQVTITNKGGTTAEEVIAEFILYSNGKEMDKSELQIAFAPRDSKREGWVTFSGEPAVSDSVVARVKSFKKP